MPIILLLLAWPTPDELKALPDVAAVQVRSVDSPTHRVIHILDWHYIPEKRFRIDTPDGDYDAFLDDVEALQAQQRAFIKAVGVKAVFKEGLTAANASHYRKRVETLRKFKPPKGDDAIDLFVARLRREDELQLGAPGKMLIAKELDSVLPGDDADLHGAADPTKGDELEFDEAANKAREDAIAKLLLARKESIIILGGDHDLSDNLSATVEYVRVTLKGYKSAAE
jgi:hypothetical protein